MVLLVGLGRAISLPPGMRPPGMRRWRARCPSGAVDQPMHGLVAVPVAGLLLVRRGPDLHSRQSTPSSTLEVKMSDRLLTIGELARRAGVAPSALRYYQELGLLPTPRSEEHTSELQSRPHLVCRLLLEKKKKKKITYHLQQKKTKQKHQ